MPSSVHESFHARPPSQASSYRLAASLLAVLLSVAACGARAQVPALSPGHIEQHGTVTLSAPRATVIWACMVALGMSGFAIEVAEPETGLIVARRKEEADRAGGVHFRSYVVEVGAYQAGRVVVTMTPALSKRGPAGSVPLETWDLADEQQAWSRLFGDVRLILERMGERD